MSLNFLQMVTDVEVESKLSGAYPGIGIRSVEVFCDGGNSDGDDCV